MSPGSGGSRPPDPKSECRRVGPFVRRTTGLERYGDTEVRGVPEPRFYLDRR